MPIFPSSLLQGTSLQLPLSSTIIKHHLNLLFESFSQGAGTSSSLPQTTLGEAQSSPRASLPTALHSLSLAATCTLGTWAPEGRSYRTAQRMDRSLFFHSPYSPSLNWAMGPPPPLVSEPLLPEHARGHCSQLTQLTTSSFSKHSLPLPSARPLSSAMTACFQ